MTFEIDVNGRLRTVSIERTGARQYRVVLDGTPHAVDAVRFGEYGLSLLVDGDAGTSREIHVAPGTADGERLIALDGRTIAARLDGRRRRSSAEGGSGGAGEQSLTAPMPGRVVRVLVAAGDEVTARQGLVVVEAMKMENELRAPRAGRVKEVAVAAGASVDAGHVLVVIE